jgi:hypothetical protein
MDYTYYPFDKVVYCNTNAYIGDSKICHTHIDNKNLTNAYLVGIGIINVLYLLGFFSKKGEREGKVEVKVEVKAKNVKPTYKLLKWIDTTKLDWYKLCKNKHAMDYLAQNITKFYSKTDCWVNLNRHLHGIELLEKYPEKILWQDYYFLRNPNAIPLFGKYLDKITNGLYANPNPDVFPLLQPFIDNNVINIDWWKLCSNPNGIDIIQNEMKKPNFNFMNLCWYALSCNPNAYEILRKNVDKIDWEGLVSNTNPQALTLLIPNINKLSNVGWKTLSRNPYAIHILEKYPEKIDYYELCYNMNAMSLIEKYQHKICWDRLSSMEHAVPLLERNKDKIYWRELSANSGAIHLIEQNMDKVSWSQLSKNPNAIHILEQHKDKIDWYELSENPSIFTLQ